MKTLRLAVDPHHLETPEAHAALDRAAAILRAGGLVALPTETVYGLGANAFDREAVERIFAAKSRPAWDPVIVHIASEAMLQAVVGEESQTARRVPDAARRLIDAFWPGPLTLLLPKSGAVPDVVTAGRPLVGVRMPSHPVALELILRAGVPVAAPSANRFGHVSPTTAEHVLHDLDGRIDMVLDGGPSPRGVESTVLDPAASPMIIYRSGAVTADQIRSIAGPVELYRGDDVLRETPSDTPVAGTLPPGTHIAALPSPGVGLKHYAPRARLVLVEAPAEELASCLAAAAEAESGERVGVMLPEGIRGEHEIRAAQIYAWGKWGAPETLARDLYAGLRALDAAACTVILCPLPPAEGIGAAIRDRLVKAGTEGTSRRKTGNREQGTGNREDSLIGTNGN
ncbi:MAG: L-threonylcarbamoyladenylate synthase [Terracidiphilus sp.]